jgi:hypothetical protein
MKHVPNTRKRGSKMRKTEYVPFRLSLKDRQRLDEMANECGMSRSELLRHIVQTTRVQVVTPQISPVTVQEAIASEECTSQPHQKKCPSVDGRGAVALIFNLNSRFKL